MGLRELPAEFTRVTPTRRLAHDLRIRWDATCVANGLEVWRTPDVVTWDELIERMFTVDREAGRLAGRWLPLSAAQIAWDRIVRDDSDIDPLLSPSGVARAAYLSWRRMHDYAIPLRCLERDGTPETEAFARWCDRYARWLAASNWVDAALAQQTVHSAAAGPGLELVGFDRSTPVQEMLLHNWAASGLEVRRATAPTTRARVVRVNCIDRTSEIDAAARWAADLLDRNAACRIAIVVPDLSRRRAEVRRLVERVIAPGTGLTGGPAPESQGFELAAARPLAEQPVVAAALDLLDTFTGAPDAPALSRLLRSAFIADAAAEGPARARLDAHLRRHETALTVGLRRLAQIAAERGCPILAQILLAGQEVVEKWPHKSVPNICASSVFELLSALGWAQAPLDSPAHQAEQRWRQLVSEFAATDEVTGALSHAGAARLLRELAARVLFEPQEIRAPLLVIDPDTCAGMQFDAAWICGLDAARWPPPAAPDPFLPIAVQRQQGVPRASAELAVREASETLDRLLRSAADVVLSVPMTEDGAPLLPSPLLDGIAMRELGAAWSAPRVAVALFQGRPALESVTDDRLPPLSLEEARRGGARLLELQSACPFRAQAEIRLGAAALDDPSPGVGAAVRGDLVHAVLARLWRELGEQAALLALDAAATRSLVERTVAAALADARRSADDVHRHLLDLEANWLAARVLEILQCDRERAPFSVLAVEAPCALQLGRLVLELRPDRVDRLVDGSLAVIDYKTGANADVKAWLDIRPRLPQLPAYVQSLAPQRVGAVAFARVRSGETGYSGLARSTATFPGLKVVGEKGGPPGFDSWEQLAAEWRRRLEALAAEYADGDGRLTTDPSRACRYCHLGALCRIAGTRLAADDRDD